MNTYSSNTTDNTLMVRDTQGNYERATPEAILRAARYAIESLQPVGSSFTSPNEVKNYFRAKLAGLEQEVFAVMFLNIQNQIIEYVEMFHGSIAQTAVYPREIVKHAMRINANAVIIGHNHPSGKSEPSSADFRITSHIKEVLELVEVRTLDHIIVAGDDCLSFSEAGFL